MNLKNVFKYYKAHLSNGNIKITGKLRFDCLGWSKLLEEASVFERINLNVIISIHSLS